MRAQVLGLKRCTGDFAIVCPDLFTTTPSSPFCAKNPFKVGVQTTGGKSVIIPSISPKPDLVALTGGYRKTPVLQVGADIYCDTALICDVLEHIQPEPVLYPPHLKGVSRVFAQWADSTLFWASMAYNLQPKGAEMLFASLPPAAAQAFARRPQGRQVQAWCASARKTLRPPTARTYGALRTWWRSTTSSSAPSLAWPTLPPTTAVVHPPRGAVDGQHL